jgi:group I intron endonuclease
MGWLYRIKNKMNGKSYIGQTIRPIEKRLKEHREGHSKGCRRIYNAIQKYGWDNFEIDWYECVNENLNDHEEFLIEMLGTLSPNGYNLTEGGGNRKPSEETNQKRRESQSGENGYWYGKNHSDESKKKVGDGNRGKTRSKETRQQHSESTKGEKHHRSKRVYQYDLDGNFINSFGSTGEANRHLKKNSASIRKCANGTCRTAYNFKWSYIKY